MMTRSPLAAAFYRKLRPKMRKGASSAVLWVIENRERAALARIRLNEFMAEFKEHQAAVAKP